MDERMALRSHVRGAYDLQKLRIMLGNRIVANYKAKMGQKPGKPESEMDAEGKAVLAEIRGAFDSMTGGLLALPTNITKGFKKGDPIISGVAMFTLVAEYLEIEATEKRHFKMLEHILADFPIWTEFLKGVKGCGPAMAGVIISEIDIHKARHPSSIHKYAGLDVAQDGHGRSRKKEHLVEREYVDRDGKNQMRVGITFNPFLKTKLTGVLATSFLRAGKDNKYPAIYYAYRHRMENHEKWGEHNDKIKGETGKAITSKGKRHNMSMRYMIKMFLIDLHVAWRGLEGLPVSEPYSVAKLGRRPHGE